MTTVRPQRKDYAHWTALQVRWGDMDALGHVNNVVFFTYDESARLAFFGELMKGDTKFWDEYGLILAHIECDFLAQLKPPATLDVGFRISKVGRTSLSTEGGMFLGDQLVAITRGVVVWFDYRTNTPLPIPDAVRSRIGTPQGTA